MTDEEFCEIYNNEEYENLHEVAEVLGISRRMVTEKASKIKAKIRLGKSDLTLIDRSQIKSEKSSENLIEFSFKEIPEPIIKLHSTASVKRYILTSAQDCTTIHEEFFNNLLAYNDYLNFGQNTCEILISGFTYNKNLFESHAKTHTWFDKRIRPYIVNERVNLGSDIVFCGEMNTLPTATTPLSGFESYTGQKWGIFPHPKVQLISIATQKNLMAKQIMTTGAVTKPNYVMKKAGIKAQFHHIFGAVLVEIDTDGTFFCRHLIADSSGSFYDLDKFIMDEYVHTEQSIKILTCGDLHVENMEPAVRKTTWESENCLLDYLKPSYQVWHDVLDFSYCSHHNIQDHHHRFRMSLDKNKTVEQSIKDVSQFISVADRPFCQAVIIQSNHDNAMLRWLKEADYRDDPANAIYFLKIQLAYYQAMENEEQINIFKYALELLDEEFDFRIAFVDQDDSFIIGDIENGLHGHLGANGSRGSAKQFSRMGVKTNTGHTHSPQILDGSYVAGTNSILDPDYAKGPSSWSHSNIITYNNNKRTILTFNNGKWYV